MNALVEVLLVFIGSCGTASTLYIFKMFRTLYKVTDDPGYNLTAFGFLFMALGLLTETLMHVSHLYRLFTGTYIYFPLSIELDRRLFCPLAPVFFVVAYTLYFSGVYVSNKMHKFILVVPLYPIAGILGEMNLLMLIMLLASYIYIIENKNTKFIVFFTLLVISHLIVFGALLNIEHAFYYMRIAFTFRALAPAVLLCLIKRGGEGQ